MTRKANSVQYMKRAAHLSLEEVALEYFNWLPSLFGGLINVKKDEKLIQVEICLLCLPLLKLKRMKHEKRTEFKVDGGLLSKEGGIFSFHLQNDELITSLIEFSPRLPWPIYRITQYPFHELIMFLFSQHLITLR